MTETGLTVFLMDEHTPANKLGSVGTPGLFTEVRVVDPQGDDAPRGQRGEMLVKGPGVPRLLADAGSDRQDDC